MKLLIDNLNAITGWSASGGSTTIHGLNDHERYIAGYLDKSIVFKFNGLNSYVEKTLSPAVDTTGYDEFVVHIYSRKKGKEYYHTVDDFSYKITFGSGKEYYLPVYESFNHVVLYIGDISSLEKIRVTALHGDEDYLIMSYALITKDIIPLDIFDGIKEGIENYRDQQSTILLGTKDLLATDDEIDLTDYSYVHDAAVIKITGGGNTEYHQLRKKNEGVFQFTDLYDGNVLLYNYTAASIYLFLPVEHGSRNTLEAIIPGITIWGVTPEEVMRGANFEMITDTWSSAGVWERQQGQLMKWRFFADCEARQDEILNLLAEHVRSYVGRKMLYINGKHVDVFFDGVAVYLEPTESFDIIPKIQYPIYVEIREDIWARKELVMTDTINLTVEVE